MEVKKATETQWAMGYFFVVRKRLCQEWNLCFDENLRSYAYAEDLDFTFSYYKKAKQDNYRCILTPDVIVRHHCSKEWRISSKKSTFMYLVNRKYLHYKHFQKMSGGYFLPRLCLSWTNFSMLLFRIIKNDNYKDYIKAMIFCVKYKNDIEKGVLHLELY